MLYRWRSFRRVSGFDALPTLRVDQRRQVDIEARSLPNAAVHGGPTAVLGNDAVDHRKTESGPPGEAEKEVAHKLEIGRLGSTCSGRIPFRISTCCSTCSGTSVPPFVILSPTVTPSSQPHSFVSTNNAPRQALRPRLIVGRRASPIISSWTQAAL
jgi:hypothetical protein